MTTPHVALLRGINVGRAKRIAMADLRAVLAGLGYGDVRTLAVSGNVTFTAVDRAVSIEQQISGAVHRDLGLRVDVLVRTAMDLDAVVAANPFVARGDAVDLLHATFLSTQPTPAALAALDPAAHQPDEFAVGDRVVYCVQPNGVLASALPAWDRALDCTVTARTWKTVLKLQALASG